MKILTIKQLKQFLGITEIPLVKTTKYPDYLIHHDHNLKYKISMHITVDPNKPLIAVRKKGRGYAVFAIVNSYD